MVPLGLLLAILGTILAQKWSPWGSSSPSWPKNGPLGAPLGDLGHHLGPKMVPLELLLAIMGTILIQEWSPWGSSWRSWPQSWPKMAPLGVLLAILGTILAQNGPLGGPLGDLGHNLERHSLYSQTPDQPQSGRYLYHIISYHIRSFYFISFRSFHIFILIIYKYSCI